MLGLPRHTLARTQEGGACGLSCAPPCICGPAAASFKAQRPQRGWDKRDDYSRGMGGSRCVDELPLCINSRCGFATAPVLRCHVRHKPARTGKGMARMCAQLRFVLLQGRPHDTLGCQSRLSRLQAGAVKYGSARRRRGLKEELMKAGVDRRGVVRGVCKRAGMRNSRAAVPGPTQPAASG
jgi:hypothetical protein